MNRYDDRARLVFHYAREEGNRLGHAMVGPEHLLLGVLRENGDAARALERFGGTLERVRQMTEEIVGRGEGSRLNDAASISPRARRVMELASEEARALGQTVTQTPHILLGIIREGDGVAYRILQDLTRDVDGFRDAVLERLRDPSSGSAVFTPAPTRAQIEEMIEVFEQHLGSMERQREELLRNQAEAPASEPSSPPKNPYDDGARLVFHHGREEAQRLAHAMVGPEHLLLGLMREDSTAAQILQEFGATLGGLRQNVEEIIGRGEDPKTVAVNISPRARRVMELALSEAQSLGVQVVSTQHILLGLIREGDGVSFRILQDLSQDIETIRWRVLAQNPAPPMDDLPQLEAHIQEVRQQLEALRLQRDRSGQEEQGQAQPSSEPQPQTRHGSSPLTFEVRPVVPEPDQPHRLQVLEEQMEVLESALDSLSGSTPATDHAALERKWLIEAPLGLVCVGLGLTLTLEANTRKNARKPYFWMGTLGLCAVGAGLSLLGDAVKTRTVLELERRR